MLIAWIAPRGIVAAAVAGLFGAQLSQKGYAGAELLLPLIFALIILTVVLHGLSIGWIARRLNLASAHPDGVMIVAASPWSTALAVELQNNEIPVLLIDTRWKHLKSARMQNIPVHYGEVLSERTEEMLELSHITKLLTLTPNEAYNTLVCSRFSPELGSHNVYEMGWKTEKDNSKIPGSILNGYSLFGKSTYYEDFRQKNVQGWQFESTPLSEQFTLDHILDEKPEGSLLIAAIDKTRHVHFYPFRQDNQADTYTTVISYVPQDLS